jgi:DNA-binding GntR family transcriptional regulator
VAKQPTTRDPRRDAIADALRDAIIRGRLLAGERLVEDAVAAEYGVSRVPVREALNRLEREGFVTLTPFRGATVSATSVQDSTEHMQIRRGLEVLAAQLAAQAQGGTVRDELANVVELGKAASREHKIDELPAMILRFHQLVAEASGNRRLKEMLDRLLLQISWGFKLDIEERLDSSWSDHSAIATAILNGQPTHAGYLMDEHISKDEALYAIKSGVVPE